MNPIEIQQLIDQECAACDATIERAKLMKLWLPKFAPILSALPSLRFCYYYPHSAKVIMAVETRADLAIVRALHKGTWHKAPHNDGDGNLKYTAMVEGVHIDIRVVELPPSCKIVEEKQDVPETLVPAHIRTIRKLVCTDPAKEDAQRDKIISVKREPSELERHLATV